MISLALAFLQAVEAIFSITITDTRFYQACQTLVPCGTIFSYLGSSVPSGWLLCSGQAVSRTTYANLFSLIGTTYGAGNGTSTFNVPNFQGCFLRGNGSQTVGGISYASAAPGTVQADELQGHVHGLPASQGTSAVVLGASSTGVAAWSNGASGYVTKYDGTVPIMGSTYDTDGTNGAARVGTETRPLNYSVNFIIAT